jgi:hypothetical protein
VKKIKVIAEWGTEGFEDAVNELLDEGWNRVSNLPTIYGEKDEAGSNHFLFCILMEKEVPEQTPQQISSPDFTSEDRRNAGSFFAECPCLCHTDPNIRHCAPCCSQCPYCLRNIVGDLDAHIQKEHPTELLRNISLAERARRIRQVDIEIAQKIRDQLTDQTHCDIPKPPTAPQSSSCSVDGYDPDQSRAEEIGNK